MAKLFYQSVKYMTFSFMILLATISFFLRVEIIKAFGVKDPKVLEICVGIIWINIIIAVPDSFKGSLKGVIKALNLQGYCACINLIGHWAINLTLMLLLGFYFKLRIKGFWLAKTVLEVYCSLAYVFLCEYYDWQDISDAARKKMGVINEDISITDEDSRTQK